MQDRLILDQQQLDITISRMCHQLVELHDDFADTVLLGLQPRGKLFAKRIQTRLSEILGHEIPLGFLDITFHRDDFRRRESPLKANATEVNFIIEEKKVVLIDDVLYTGRSVRAALDAMIAFGRPAKVELMVLIDRKYTRHLPIEPDYTGKAVNTLASQNVAAEWREQGFESDNIWIKHKI
ncbi:bifunctional pyr operon transcriptional regulator/uracil phosphoribosyltransferase PyrR [Penaeicola halotolerans]|uniref:bifunctional pyr operon transcriptional regulator/uracil phosphoribosyltransferase PyrR n=1 Tax=Penaeicola halotolerans TaxID=2793196 RepID=UPI001CF8B4DE|nr:bifunctional pyr operon transcriptional regulator/uracil phosphoribosyltransferase PyrR [Penaeicola halotolerans]